MSVLKPIVPVFGLDGRPAEFHVAILEIPVMTDKLPPILIWVVKFFDSSGLPCGLKKGMLKISLRDGETWVVK